MQTFITDFDMIQNAKNLDNKRLGKQRVESIYIAEVLLKNNKNGYKNHPIVKLWKGYESYLIIIYLRSILNEWESRGFKNVLCNEHYKNLVLEINPIIVTPPWITKEFIEAHRSNLIRKNPEYYKKLWPNTKEGLKYIWNVDLWQK
jgi:hypothetical protein